MSRHLNTFESKNTGVKLVNGIEIRKAVPLEEQDPNGVLTLTFHDVESYGTVKVELRVSVEELAADLSKSVRDLNRDSCIFPQKFTAELQSPGAADLREVIANLKGPKDKKGI